MAAGLVAFSSLEARAAANDRVSLAVIGVRGQGQSLATGFAALPDVDVVAVCDVDDRVAAEAATAVEKITGKAPRKERAEWKRWVAGIALVALLILIAQNSQKVEVNFFFASTETPLVFALAIAGVLGALVGWLAPRVRRRDRREE